MELKLKKKLSKLFLILYSFNLTANVNIEEIISSCNIEINNTIVNEIKHKDSFFYICENYYFIQYNLVEKILNKQLLENKIEINGIDFIDIKNISGMFRYKTNNNINITFEDPKTFNISYLDFKNKNKNKMNKPLNGIKLNYDFNLNYIKNEEKTKTILNNQNTITLFSENGFLQNSSVLTSDENKITRLNTFYRKDFIKDANTLIIGDSVTNNGSWENSFRFAGIKFSKNFTINPNIITYPTPDLSLSSVVPTSIDLYINEVKKINTNVEPGNYFLDYMPNMKGGNNIKMETRDIFGRKKEVEINFYSSTELLKPGIHDYSFEFGALRKNYGVKSFDYEDLIFNYKHQYGIDDTLTIENSGFYVKDTLFPGITIKKSIFNKLLLTTSIAVNTKKMTDSLFRFSLEHSNNEFSIKTILETTDESFYKNKNIQYQPKKYGFTGRYKLPLNLGSLSGSYFENQIYEELDDKILKEEILTLNYNKIFKKKYMISLNLIRNLNRETMKDDVYVGFNINIPLYPTHKNSYINSKVSNNDMGFSFSKNKDVSKPIDESYKFLYNEKFDKTYNGNIETSQYRKNYITSQSFYFNNENNIRIDSNIKGDIVYAKNEVFLSQPTKESFGIIDIPETKNVRIYSNNNYVGKTDKNGRLFIPNLTPYYSNKIKIETTDVPFNKDLKEQNIILKPYFNNGNYKKFEFYEINPAYLKITNNKDIKIGAKIIVHHNNKIIEETLFGENGIIFLNNLSKGNNLIEIISEDKTYKINLNFTPNKETGVTYLGEFEI